MQRRITEQGFTLTEALVVTAMFALLMYVMMDSIAAFYRHNAYSIAQSYEVATARRGVETLVQDMREMTYADDGTFPLATTSANLIGFYSDIDKDDSVEYVEYEIVANELIKRTFNAAGDPPTYSTTTPDQTFIISEYVQNVDQATSTFSYYDENGSSTDSSSLITDIRYIEVQIIVNVDPGRDPGEFMLRSSAAPRNLKENL